MRIAISGNIGVGKSTLCKELEKRGYMVKYETLDNEILDLFYEHKTSQTNLRRAEKLNQFNFLLETIKREILSELKNEKTVIYDRPLTDHIHIFAKKNLTNSEYVIYNGFQEIFLNLLEFNKYDLTVVLTADMDTILSRINTRGRACEKNDKLTQYYSDLNEMYNSYEYFEQVKHHSNTVIRLDTTEMSSSELADFLIKAYLD